MAADNKKLPIPIHEKVVVEGKLTPALVRYLNALQNKVEDLEKRLSALEP